MSHLATVAAVQLQLLLYARPAAAAVAAWVLLCGMICSLYVRDINRFNG